VKTLVCKEELIFNPPELGCGLYLPGLPGSGSKIYDRSPYGNNGTITGATWTRLPGGLWCLSFDGTDDYVNCGNAASLHTSANLSIEMWAKTPADWSGLNQGLIDKRTPPQGYLWQIYDGHLSLYCGGTGGDASVNVNPPANPELWHHYAMVLKGGEYLYLFINGELENFDTSDIPSDFTETSANVIIGARQSGGNFSGVIALTKIYNRVLSALEIQNHFSREKGLFGVW